MTDIPSRSVVWASKPCGVAIHGVKNQTRSCLRFCLHFLGRVVRGAALVL